MRPPERVDGPVLGHRADPSTSTDTNGHPTADTAENNGQALFDALRRRQCGRYADVWREGFAYGFQDALRLAGRRLPPETWAVLDQLAREYDLASAA